MSEIKIGVTFPGEAIVINVLELIAKYRDTMSQENRDNWDKLGFAIVKAWHNQAVALGWPGEKI